MTIPLGMKIIKNHAVCFGCALVLLLSVPARGATPAGKPIKNKKPDLTADLFQSDQVRRVQIEMPESALEVLRKYQWQFGQQMEREAVQVTVREGQNTYTNVALHLKGAAGSFRSIDDNPSMTLNFDRFAKGQKFHGLTKLSLNNSVQDSTYVSEQLCRELFLQVGVPTPRAGHAFVELNGRDLGLYVLVEGWDRAFLKRHFKNTRGNLYDGGFVKEVTDSLTTNSGENPKDQSDREALATAAKESDLSKRLTALEKCLDMNRFLTFIAMDVILWNWDGYAYNHNNWRLYHDLDSGRMVFMPHGLDQMFWNPDGSVLPPMQGLVAKSALEIPSLRQRYFDKLKELSSSVIRPEALTNRVQAISKTFSSALRQKDPKLADDQANAATALCSAIVRRSRSLEEQLARPVVPAPFGPEGDVRLSDWKTKADFGFPQIAKTVLPDGMEALEIKTNQGSSIGSWRAKVWLEKGDYRLKGKIRTEGLKSDPGDPRGGAGFRTDRSRPENYVLGDTEWKTLDYPFSVEDALGQIQIICEFRGMTGQAWFDLNSLRVTRAENRSSQPK